MSTEEMSDYGHSSAGAPSHSGASGAPEHSGTAQEHSNTSASPLEHSTSAGAPEHLFDAAEHRRATTLAEQAKRKEYEAKAISRHVLRTNVVEITLYIGFLLAFSLVVTSSRDGSYSFWHAELMRDLFVAEEFPYEFGVDAAGEAVYAPEDGGDFGEGTRIYKNFNGIATTEEMWQWVHHVFAPGAFSYDDPVTRPNGGVHDYTGMIYGTNRLIGQIRMRTVRVVPNKGCNIPDDFNKTIKTCYARYRFNNEADEPYGSGAVQYTYNTSDDLGGLRQKYQIDGYGGGGYPVYFNPSDGLEINAEKLQNLTADGYVDTATRALFIDFTTFNGGINSFCVCQFVLEILPSGGIWPSSKIRTIRLYYYTNDFNGMAQLFGEVILLIFVMFYFCQEIREFSIMGKAYLREGWNYFDILNLVLFLVAVFLRVYISYLYNEMGITPDAKKFYEFQNIMFLSATQNNLLAVNSQLLWFKIFKYTSFLSSMSMISRVILKSLPQIVSFAIMFFFVLFGFAQAGTTAFGDSIADYRSFTWALYRLSLAALGDFNFPQLQEENRIFGPLYFFTFIVLVFIMCLNMFLAIVNSAYEEVSEEIAREQVAFDIFRSMMSVFAKSSLGKRVLAAVYTQEEVDNMLDSLQRADQDNDGRLSEVETMIALGHDPQFADLFEKYDVNNDGFLDPLEQKRLFDEVERRMTSKKEEDGKPSTVAQFSVVETAVDFTSLALKHLEDALADVQRKVDMVAAAAE